MKKIHRVTHTHPSTSARTGILSLDHGDVVTPAFMPVGTNGTVKGIYHEHVHQIGYNLILANTYHLYLRPGVDVLGQFGGSIVSATGITTSSPTAGAFKCSVCLD